MRCANPQNSWRLIDEQLQKMPSARSRQMLATVEPPIRAVCRGPLNALMATMVRNPMFHNWAGETNTGAKTRQAAAKAMPGSSRPAAIALHTRSSAS